MEKVWLLSDLGSGDAPLARNSAEDNTGDAEDDGVIDEDWAPTVAARFAKPEATSETLNFELRRR